MMQKILGIGPLFVILAALMWSADGILRISLYSLPPVVIVFYEHFLGGIILLVIIKKWFSELKKLNRKEWIAISIVSLFSGALGTIFYTSALGMVNYSQYSVVVLLQQQLQPIWAIGTAAILLREKINRKFVFWAFLALVGAYFVSFKDLRINLATGQGTIMAAVLALSAGLMWGSSTAISKYVLNKVTHLAATAVRFYLAAFFALIIIALNSQTAVLSTLTTNQWLTLIVITLSTGLVALVIYYYGLKKTPAKVTTICELVWPASAILIDYFYFHKTLSSTQIFGIVLVLFAIYKVSYFRK